MPLGKTLRLYLSDGSPTGPIVAEIINWTGQVIVVPRSQLHEMARREELQRTGIYILVGPDAQTGADRVYVGEADDVFLKLTTKMTPRIFGRGPSRLLARTSILRKHTAGILKVG
jgi:hypothetical protein